MEKHFRYPYIWQKQGSCLQTETLRSQRSQKWDSICKYKAKFIHTLLKVLLFLKRVFPGSSVKKMCLFFILICLLMSKYFDLYFTSLCRYLTCRWLKFEIPPYLWPKQKKWTQTLGSRNLLPYMKREEN